MTSASRRKTHDRRPPSPTFDERPEGRCRSAPAAPDPDQGTPKKGTGRWTAQDALELGVPLTAITEAVFARRVGDEGAYHVRWGQDGDEVRTD